jgi:hypothetical protein
MKDTFNWGLSAVVALVAMFWALIAYLLFL